MDETRWWGWWWWGCALHCTYLTRLSARAAETSGRGSVSRSIMDSACCRCLSSCWKLNLIDGPLENYIIKYISRLYSIQSYKASESRYLYAFAICKLRCVVHRDLQWYQNMYNILACWVLVLSQVVVLFQPPYKYWRVSPCHPGMWTAALYSTTTQHSANTRLDISSHNQRADISTSKSRGSTDLCHELLGSPQPFPASLQSLENDEEKTSALCHFAAKILNVF